MTLPELLKIRQQFPRPRIDDPGQRIAVEFANLQLAGRIRPGAKIAITGGSRGINGIAAILREVAANVKRLGGCPCIISAMGSHGGGTPQGQAEVLQSLGIVAETVGCPVVCSSEVVKIGRTPTDGIDVYCAREAVEADGVLIVNRVKCHTAFRGPCESGLFKMMGIGLGRVPGAEAIHSIGTESMGRVILELGRIVLDKVAVLGGLAIVENGYEETAGIYGLKPGEFETRERELLQEANGLLPRLPVDAVDILVVEEMGKDYSGTGMDTNIIGRWRIAGVKEPDKPTIKRVVVLALSEASHGNANGIGLADFTTRRLVDGIDYRATYLNSLTTGFLLRTMLPMILDSAGEAVASALRSLRLDGDQARIVWIKNTLHLDEVWVSPCLAREIGQRPDIEICGCRKLEFDAAGNIVG